VGGVALAAGLSSTAPAPLLAIAQVLPTAPALALLRSAATGDSGGAWSAAGLLLIWALGAVALTFAAVASRRTVRLRDAAPGHAAAVAR